MKLTGKALEDFEKWYREKDFIAYGRITSGVFEVMPENMQFGVYVDFFDSRDIMIGVKLRRYDSNFITYINWDSFNLYETRSEARTELIKRVNEIYNS